MSACNPIASNGQAKPVKTVTGQGLAKSSNGYPVAARTEDAAQWLAHEVEVRPTAKLACTVFGVSYPRLKQAQARLARNKRRAINGNGATNLSDSAVERIVIELGPDRILHVIDKLTQPQLPLAAAQ